MLKSRYLKWKTWGKLCNTTVKPVLVSGSEHWTLTERDGQKLRTFERKVLRQLYRTPIEKDGW
jgi:hypothetical protein